MKLSAGWDSTKACTHLGNDDARGDGHGGRPDVVLEPVAGQGATDGGGDVRQSRLVEACEEDKTDLSLVPKSVCYMAAVCVKWFVQAVVDPKQALLNMKAQGLLRI